MANGFDPRMALAQGLMAQGTQFQPSLSWQQSLGQIASALSGAYMGRQAVQGAEQEAAQRRAAQQQAMMQALQFGQDQPAPITLDDPMGGPSETMMAERRFVDTPQARMSLAAALSNTGMEPYQQMQMARDLIEAAGPEFSEMKGQAVSLLDKETGKFVWGIESQDGRVYLPNPNDPTGRGELADPNRYALANASVQAADAGGLNPQLTESQRGKQLEQITARWAETRNAISEIDNIRNIIADDFTPVGFAGKVSQFFSGAKSQLDQVTGLMKRWGGRNVDAGTGDTISLSQLLSRDRYDFSALEQAGINSAALQSNVVNLAYVLARVADPGGRLSEMDVQQQLNRLANVGLTSKRMMLATLDQVEREAITRNRNYWETAQQAGLLGDEWSPPEEWETKANERLEAIRRRAGNPDVDVTSAPPGVSIQNPVVLEPSMTPQQAADYLENAPPGFYSYNGTVYEIE